LCLHFFVCIIKEKEILIHAMPTQRFVLMMQVTETVTKTCSAAQLMPDFRKFQSDAALQQHVRDRKDAAHDKIPADGGDKTTKVVGAKSIAPTPKVITQTLTVGLRLM